MLTAVAAEGLWDLALAEGPARTAVLKMSGFRPVKCLGVVGFRDLGPGAVYIYIHTHIHIIRDYTRTGALQA